MTETGETTSTLTARDRAGHVLARLGINRSGWRVRPGLYKLGDPGPDGPVLISANYRLSFDALRSSLAGIDAWILVLDTMGINVWCAAGKGSFGTDELVARIESARLADEVETRTLIVPQLGATGVCAREVLRRSGFRVRFGPVRARDLPRFLRDGEATEEMRRVSFNVRERAVLIPVEAKTALPFVAGGALAAYLGDGAIGSAGVVAASAAGLAGFPVLMPYLPGRDFSTKGFVLGGVVGLGAAAAALLRDDRASRGSRVLRAFSYLLALPPVTSFAALNFTGCTTFTSPTGVRREIFRYVPVMAGMALAGVVVNAAGRFMRPRARSRERGAAVSPERTLNGPDQYQHARI